MHSRRRLPATLHDRTRRGDLALHGDPARDRGRLLRALRRGAATDRRRDRQAPRLAARTVALRFLPDSVQRWEPFRETRVQLDKIAKKYKVGLISNIDDKLLGQTRRHLQIDFDIVVTAQQVRSYKPDAAHFNECARRIGGKKGWVHVGSSYYHDIEPCVKGKIPVIWVNRHKETLDAGQRKPTAEVANLREAAKLLGIA